MALPGLVTNHSRGSISVLGLSMEVRFPTDSTRGDFCSPSLRSSPSLHRSFLLINRLWNQGNSFDILHDIFSIKFRFSSFLLSESEVANKDLFSTDNFPNSCFQSALECIKILRRNNVFIRRHTLTLRSSFSCNTENSKPRNITNEEFSKGNA